MAVILTRKQSMRLGLGLLASFFIGSSTIIYVRNSSRIPAASGDLSKEAIEGPSSSGTPITGIGFVLNDFHRSLERDGKLVWDITGKRGQYDAASNAAHIDEPKLLVVQENGDTMTLTAKRADVTLTANKISKADLFDDVVVTFKGETTLTTSRATYNETAGRVDIPVPLELSNPMITIKGNSAVGLIDPQEVTINGGVRTIIKPRKRK